jgi:hypothetical protein
MEENNNSVGEIVLRKARADGLIMSRVPKQTRDLFIKLSEEEFADDYGLCLKMLLDQFIEYQLFKQNFDFKLNYIITLLESKNAQEQKLPKKVKMLGGNEKNIEKEENQK